MSHHKRIQSALSGAFWKEEWCHCLWGAVWCQHATADGGMCSIFIICLNLLNMKNNWNLRMCTWWAKYCDRVSLGHLQHKMCCFTLLCLLLLPSFSSPQLSWWEVPQVRFNILLSLEVFFLSLLFSGSKFSYVTILPKVSVDTPSPQEA